MALVAALGVLIAAASASAHVELLAPAPRHPLNEIKDAPCGVPGSARGAQVTVFAPGARIEVRLREYVDHPGHYRVAFDADGDDDFRDPVCVENCDDRRQPPMVFAEDTTGTVLADFVVDEEAEAQSVWVTLPEVECERCTLQLIQVMYDKRPYTSPGNDNYYACADLALRAVAGEDLGPPSPDGGAGTSDAGGPPSDAGPTDGDAFLDAAPPSDGGSVDGGGCAAGPSGAGWALVLLGLSPWSRRASGGSSRRRGRRG